MTQRGGGEWVRGATALGEPRNRATRPARPSTGAQPLGKHCPPAGVGRCRACRRLERSLRSSADARARGMQCRHRRPSLDSRRTHIIRTHGQPRVPRVTHLSLAAQDNILHAQRATAAGATRSRRHASRQPPTEVPHARTGAPSTFTTARSAWQRKRGAGACTACAGPRLWPGAKARALEREPHKQRRRLPPEKAGIRGLGGPLGGTHRNEASKSVRSGVMQRRVSYGARGGVPLPGRSGAQTPRRDLPCISPATCSGSWHTHKRHLRCLPGHVRRGRILHFVEEPCTGGDDA